MRDRQSSARREQRKGEGGTSMVSTRGVKDDSVGLSSVTKGEKGRHNGIGVVCEKGPRTSPPRKEGRRLKQTPCPIQGKKGKPLHYWGGGGTDPRLSTPRGKKKHR